eukprot:SAG31_NODE_10938_length_1081_cov_1.262729_2_plen_87_part_01
MVGISGSDNKDSVLTTLTLVIRHPCAGGEENWITDAAGMITRSNREKINQICQRLFEKYGVESAVLTVDDVHGHSVEELHDFFTELF